MSSASQGQNVAHQLVSAYYKQPEKEVLSQGDIISLERLKANFIESLDFNLAEQAYPYFFANYNYAIILNADCDIYVKDARRAKVRCVQLAAVVEASDHIKTLLKKVANDDHYLTRIIDEKTYYAVVRKFESLINNQEKLYFYLPENQNINFKSAHLVRLDTSISIQVNDSDLERAQKKYHSVVKSRIQATLNEPYKSKLGENYASLFDRTGLTDAKDHLDDDYDEWVKQEMFKYFIAVDDAVYRRAHKEVKSLALSVGSNSSEYASKLEEIIVKHSVKPESEFGDLPAFQALKKIIEGRTKATVADGIIKNIQSDPILKSAFETLMIPPALPKSED